jgi:hypothetical protein
MENDQRCMFSIAGCPLWWPPNKGQALHINCDDLTKYRYYTPTVMKNRHCISTVMTSQQRALKLHVKKYYHAWRMCNVGLLCPLWEVTTVGMQRLSFVGRSPWTVGMLSFLVCNAWGGGGGGGLLGGLCNACPSNYSECAMPVLCWEVITVGRLR